MVFPVAQFQSNLGVFVLPGGNLPHFFAGFTCRYHYIALIIGRFHMIFLLHDALGHDQVPQKSASRRFIF